MDVIVLKAIYGMISGVLLYVLTILLTSILGVTSLVDYILISIYFILYLGYIPLMHIFNIQHRKHLTRGIAVYYSISFLTWIIIYDIAPLR